MFRGVCVSWPRAALISFCVLLSAGFQSLWWPVPAPDITLYLVPWYEHIVDKGPVGAFAYPFSNYTPTYLYLLAGATALDGWLNPFDLIKGLSTLGTLFLAGATYRLAKSAGTAEPAIAAALVLVLPTPMINAAMLGQCDALWVGCCLLAAAAALRGNMLAMVVWAGIAVSFKAQAAFIAPFVIGLLIREKAPLKLWAVPALVYVLIMSPAWLAGWPASDLLQIYLKQAGEMNHVGTAANPWVIARMFLPGEAMEFVSLGIVAGIVAAAGIIAYVARARNDLPSELLTLALLPALILPWLLPKMHERYFLLADMLAFALALAARTQSNLALAVLVQGSSLLALIAYTHVHAAHLMIGAGLSAAAVIHLLLQLHRQSRRSICRSADTACWAIPG